MILDKIRICICSSFREPLLHDIGFPIRIGIVGGRISNTIQSNIRIVRIIRIVQI